MNAGLRLNLGCGWDYKPGYVNIDSSSSTACDEVGDASDLRFADNSVDRIEAMQLLEHFDLVHCRYALAEWYRVLAPGGQLLLETPDIQTAARQLSGRSVDAEPTMRWIFGIDSPGLQHKSGFTKRILRAIISEAGFSDVHFDKPTTYTTSPGFRVVCSKQNDGKDAQVVAVFRKRLRRTIGTDDSFVLVPIEKWIAEARKEVPSLGSTEGRRKILARLASCNPALALSFAQTVSESRPSSESDLDEIEVLTWLQSMKFHQKAFALWLKSRKNQGRSKEDFDGLISRMEALILAAFNSPGKRFEAFDYVMSLESRHIDALDWWLVLQEAQKSFCKSLKAYSVGDIALAAECLEGSIMTYPDNPLAHWNMARVLARSGMSSVRVEECYGSALRLAGSQRMAKAIEEESMLAKSGRLSEIPAELMPTFQ